MLVGEEACEAENGQFRQLCVNRLLQLPAGLESFVGLCMILAQTLLPVSHTRLGGGL